MSNTQNEKILQHLQTRGDITSMQAFEQYGITRLSARIFDLRCEGYNIKSDNVKVPTRTGEQATVARYTLITKTQMEMFNG